ncbi:hypothetical protein ONE63_005034 [Megalurothrips usitatus]|uniref:Uncharacterized protein n=1 Tax=Megalurothrips usitatus TaxID=439358 RepID=A0AAV7X8E2_9NEOP|nr:hypothetical protein ONE63_005034 [Megalurothrips usitatus]
MRSRLCNCSEATQGEVLVAVLSLGLRHSLSYKAMVDILKLFNVIYQREVIPATLYYLLKFSEPTRSQEHVHPVCPDCGDFLGRATNESEIVCDCGCRLTSPKKSKNLIMTLGMKEQIKNLFEMPGIAEALSYRFKRQKCVESNWEDVYDGSLYKNLTSNGMPLSDPNNFSYAFNTDGVAFGSSSHQQLWPVYITINELPPKLRTKHMLLVGIWVGKSEPDMQVMLRPFVQEANELSVVGVDWVCHNVMKNSKVIPLFSVVDSQARWRMLNHKCFSGYYGCTFCEISGSHTKMGMRFPLDEHVPLQRTDVSLRDGMLTAYMRRNYPEKERHYKGSRGPCALMNLRDFNLGSGLPPDSMHMLKGVVQQNLGLILGKLDDDEVTKISKRIMCLQPPSVLSRLPRALKDRDKFQCSEYRALLVIYGPVVMHGIVPPKYVGHFCLLSSAMYLLMQKSVSAAQLDQAGKMLVFYVALYQKYFGEEHMTYNIHLLLHVVKSVANLGPLHGYLSCYPFEGKNRYLLQLAKSPYEVAKGVARRYAVYNNLPNLCDRFNVSDSILNFCNQMFFRPLRSAVRSDGAVLLGRGSAAILNDEEREVLCNEMKIDRPGNICKFQRMVLDGSTYTTADYNPSYRRNDSGIVIANKPRNNKCKITNIILLEEKEAVVIFARQMKECADPLWKVGSFALKHITQIREEGQLLALRPCHVGGQCMFMSTEKGTFVTCIPHGCRGD